MSEKTYDYFCRNHGCEYEWSDPKKFTLDRTFCPKCGSWKVTVRDR